MNDREVESALDEELMLIVKLLAAVYPLGCEDVVVIPGVFCGNRKKCRNSVKRLTPRLIMVFIYQLIYKIRRLIYGFNSADH